MLIDKAYINENLSRFENAASADSAPVEEISDLYGQYAGLVNITEETLEGYNAFKSGRVLLQVSGIRTLETLPELLYYAVSGILALCAGCGIFVFLACRKTKEEYETK